MGLVGFVLSLAWNWSESIVARRCRYDYRYYRQTLPTRVESMPMTSVWESDRAVWAIAAYFAAVTLTALSTNSIIFSWIGIASSGLFFIFYCIYLIENWGKFSVDAKESWKAIGRFSIFLMWTPMQVVSIWKPVNGSVIDVSVSGIIILGFGLFFLTGARIMSYFRFD
jgi:hypothetical protein